MATLKQDYILKKNHGDENFPYSIILNWYGTEFKLPEDINNSDLIQSELGYEIREREDLIQSILDMISEARWANRTLMEEDLEYLYSLDDTVIFSSVNTNDYIAKDDDPERFDELCEKIVLSDVVKKANPDINYDYVYSE